MLDYAGSPSPSACRRSRRGHALVERNRACRLPRRRRSSSRTAAIRSHRRTSRRWRAGHSRAAGPRRDGDASCSRTLTRAFRAMLAGEVIRTVVVFDPRPRSSVQNEPSEATSMPGGGSGYRRHPTCGLFRVLRPASITSHWRSSDPRSSTSASSTGRVSRPRSLGVAGGPCASWSRPGLPRPREWLVPPPVPSSPCVVARATRSARRGHRHDPPRRRRGDRAGRSRQPRARRAQRTSGADRASRSPPARP